MIYHAGTSVAERTLRHAFPFPQTPLSSLPNRRRYRVRRRQDFPPRKDRHRRERVLWDRFLRRRESLRRQPKPRSHRVPQHAGTAGLDLLRFEPPDQAKIRFTQISKVPSLDTSTGLQTTQFKYLAAIPEDVEPRIYLITIVFAYPGNDASLRTNFWLYLGVRSKGKLSVVTDDVSTTELYTGTTNPYRLELENNFPDYPVNIRSITIKSNPLGLIESQTVANKTSASTRFSAGRSTST